MCTGCGRPTEHIRWHQWTDRVVLDDEGGIAEYQAVGRDITDQRLAEEAAVKSEALANEQARVLQLITTSAPIDEILQEMCRVVELHVPGARCSIQLLNEDGTDGPPPFRHRSARALLVEADRVLGRPANARHALAHVRPPAPARPRAPEDRRPVRGPRRHRHRAQALRSSPLVPGATRSADRPPEPHAVPGVPRARAGPEPSP